jgi:hypothetical protein
MTAKREDPEKTEPQEIIKKKIEIYRKKSQLPRATVKGQAPGSERAHRHGENRFR